MRRMIPCSNFWTEKEEEDCRYQYNPLYLNILILFSVPVSLVSRTCSENKPLVSLEISGWSESPGMWAGEGSLGTTFLRDSFL